MSKTMQLNSFCRFYRTPTCDRCTQTDGHRVIVIIGPAWRRAVKKTNRPKPIKVEGTVSGVNSGGKGAMN